MTVSAYVRVCVCSVLSTIPLTGVRARGASSSLPPEATKDKKWAEFELQEYRTEGRAEELEPKNKTKNSRSIESGQSTNSHRRIL